MRRLIKWLPALLPAAPATVFADEMNGPDTAWILASTALVFFMTLPGLALFYGCLVRSKNMLSVLRLPALSPSSG